MGFALGLLRAGWMGGLAAWVGFTLPSALLMLAFAFGHSLFDSATGVHVLHGLQLVAVAVVAQAVLTMQRSLAPDRIRTAIAVVATAMVLFAPAGFVSGHVAELEKLVRATGRGWSYAQAHPDETARMIVAKYAPDSSYAEQRASLGQTLKLVWSESPRFGMMQDATWRASVAMFERYKLVDGELKVGDLVDDAVLRELYAAADSPKQKP